MLNEKTVTIRRKNVFLDVAPEQVERYMAKGYDVVDPYGNVIKKGTPTNPEEYKNAYEASLKKIAELEGKIKELETQLKAKSQASAKADDKVETSVKSSGRKSKK